MRLRELLESLGEVELSGDPEVEIAGVEADSRWVGPGCLFVALLGEARDGNDFVGAALAAGAAAVLSQKRKPPGTEIAWVRVPDARASLAHLARRWFGAPDSELTLVGITGTNGKTSVAHLLQAILGRCRGPAGRIGTISYSTGRREIPAGLTTPEAPQIVAMLREMRDAGCRSAALEASSHAIDRKRVLALEFDLLVFTNLSRDHLDYHGDMESYYRAKRGLFRTREESSPLAAINVDDPWGRRLRDEIELECIAFGEAADADVRPLDIEIGIEGTRLAVATPHEQYVVRSRLIGRPNVQNILAACAAAHALGFAGEDVAAALAKAPTVRGRLERVPAGRGYDVIVDYAHTDDALRRLLLTARELTRGRVLVVFGCGGDRDRGKRPLMGAHAAALADVAVLTSDNPRSEDPLAIIAEVEAGMAAAPEPRAKLHTIPDRRRAIEAALGMARTGDLVLVAGKGHEDYQLVGGRRLHFDDREAVMEAIASP